MITSISWMPKEVSKAMAEKTKDLTESDLTGMDDGEIEEMADELKLDEVSHAKAVAKSFGKPCSESNGGASSSSTTTSKDADEVAKFLKELEMDKYDEEDDEIDLFSSGMGDLYYQSNDMDPYMNNDNNTNNDDYDFEELDAITVRPTDSLIICTSIVDCVSYLNVYIYEDSGNWYPRNEILIPKAPLCTAWLDCPTKAGDKGNFVAIGSMEPTIDIWDLDDLDKKVQPCVRLGQVTGQTSDCHTKAVLGLAWNKEFRNIVASASVDKKVKIWDVATGQCKLTTEHHKKKVKAVAWNPFTPQVLLSGSYDRTAVLEDGRDPSRSGLKWSTKARVEDLAWDPCSEHSFVVSLKDGTAKGYDVRASSLSPSFTLHAHDDEVSSISYNTHTPNLLATGSGDGSVKLWDLSNNQPSWIATHIPIAGEVFSVSFSADMPFLLAIGGLEGGLKFWDTHSAVSRRYGRNLP